MSISLRDRFAASAMQWGPSYKVDDAKDAALFASWCYTVADAMIFARQSDFMNKPTEENDPAKLHAEIVKAQKHIAALNAERDNLLAALVEVKGVVDFCVMHDSISGDIAQRILNDIHDAIGGGK